MAESHYSMPDDPQEEKLSEHCYDGIQEYDNPTPFWWDLLFVGSIIFAPFYILWFHAPKMGRTHAAQYDVALADNMRLQFGEIGELTADEQTILKYMEDPKWLTVGQATFATHCVSCHGTEGQGISGPNLTDEYYLNVKQVADIGKVIQNGAKAGAMPAWSNRLHPNEIVLAASYVASMRGQNLTSPRPAEGNEIAPWPKADAEQQSEPEEEPAQTE